MKTLNQLVLRIKTLALAHKQIRRFRTGLAGDLFADKTAKYPACCLQYSTGGITTSGHATSINFRMFLMDLVNVAQDTKANEDDVLSDTLLIMQDLVSEMNNGNFNDWFLKTDNQITSFVETDGDMYAGWFIDFNIRMIYRQNVCEIPSDVFDYVTGGGGDGSSGGSKEVFDYTYISTGTEGTSLTIPTITGMKVLLVIRAGNPIYKVSNAPNSDEYVWDNTQFTFGIPLEANLKVLILYRNY